MAALARLGTTLLVMTGEIATTAAIDVTEDAADHPDAPTATRMHMLRAEATEIASAKIDMGALAVTVENENGTAIEVIEVASEVIEVLSEVIEVLSEAIEVLSEAIEAVIEALEGSIAAMMARGRLVGTVKDLVERTAVVVLVGASDEIVVAGTAMRISLRRTNVAGARPLRRNASPRRILPMSFLSPKGSVV